MVVVYLGNRSRRKKGKYEVASDERTAYKTQDTVNIVKLWEMDGLLAQFVEVQMIAEQIYSVNECTYQTHFLGGIALAFKTQMIQ